jgi:glycosyltransferase involved in cell wall biosynthesis
VSTPILLWSDSPAGPSGLARITRELATRLTAMPEFEVATVGYGSASSRKLPFHQYHWTKGDDWIVRELPEVWEDFIGDRDGILMTIMDLGRMLWLAHPEQYPNEPVCQWLQQKKPRIWAYVPIDAEGPNGKLSYPLKETICEFERVLLYSQWAVDLCRRSGIENVSAIPHGIEASIFTPHSRRESRRWFGTSVVGQRFSFEDDHFVIGVVATNQPRKDWHLAIETAAILRDKYGKNVRLWLHTDRLERHWSIPTLLVDYGFMDATKSHAIITTGDLSDEQMAVAYSACDVTLAPGRGEGFGFPLAESLACGTPVIHGAYGGAVDWMPKQFLVHPCGYNHEGLYGEKRPVFSAGAWAECAVNARREDAKLPPCLEWGTLWKEFENWFRQGVQ